MSEHYTERVEYCEKDGAMLKGRSIVMGEPYSFGFSNRYCPGCFDGLSEEGKSESLRKLASNFLRVKNGVEDNLEEVDISIM